MPIADFQGTTFVAFTDISGFKEMMKDERRAVRALDNLNNAGFGILRDRPDVNGFFISDCGVLFVRVVAQPISSQLRSLLDVIAQLNRRLIDNDVMLTTSIAYGPFSYHQRLEFVGIEKNPLYGNAYVSAFLDNENGSPRIQPGQCRILRHGLDQDAVEGISRVRRKGGHWYYYWNVEADHDIEAFERMYADSYNLKYFGMLQALKGGGQQ